tara:strand:+ start:339 stop:560 length:222 start_codon:yes stop_codon:yes gene_type:complete
MPNLTIFRQLFSGLRLSSLPRFPDVDVARMTQLLDRAAAPHTNMILGSHHSDIGRRAAVIGMNGPDLTLSDLK